MAKFLFTVWPYPGNIHPNIAVAQTLQDRGHEVGFYTGAVYRGVLEAEGFALFPFQRVVQRLWTVVGGTEGQERATDTPVLYERLAQYQSGPFRRRFLVRGLQLESVYLESVLGTVPQQVADLQPVLSAWQPDVIVCDPDLWGPILILHELHRIPVAVLSYYMACLIPGPDAPPIGFGFGPPRTWPTRMMAEIVRGATDLLMTRVRREASAMRQRYGLPQLTMRIHEFMGQMPLHLVTSVPELDYQRHDLPPSVHYVGPCLWDKPREEPPQAWLDDLPRSNPVVYVSEGTTYVRPPIVLRAAARGLADQPLEVILTTGPHRDPVTLRIGTLAPNVRLERWVPQSDVLSRASVVVTHGGAGSTMGALQAGLPLVVVPLQWEQRDTARRIVETGAGVQLEPRRCTPARLRTAVKRMLDDPSFRHQAEQLASIFARYGGAQRAATLLENLATHQAIR